MIVSMSHPLFIKAKSVIEQIESHGYEAYFVGGCVRDLLLDRPVHDIDIATSAFPQEIQEIFPKTFDVGIEHGTVVVLHGGEQYEITTFRTEGKYSDYRRPDTVKFVRNLEEDTLRRDFTMNALAMDSTGRLFDFHGGIEDLEGHRIACVGNARERFSEDALRMMRAIRFASQLGFSIEAETYSAIVSLSSNLAHIAVERIRIEFNKYLVGPHFLDNYQLIYETGLSDYLPGDTPRPFGVAMYRLYQDLEGIGQTTISEHLAFVWSRLLDHLEVPLDDETYLRQWTHSNDFIRQVKSIRQLISAYESQELDTWLIHQHTRDNIAMVQGYLEAKYQRSLAFVQEKEAIPIQSKSDLSVKGQDIMSILELKKGGPLIGEILNRIEYLVVHQQMENDPVILRDFVQDNYK